MYGPLMLLLKARTHKYHKREKKGNRWVYYYTKAEYDKAKGKGVAVADKYSVKITKEDITQAREPAYSRVVGGEDIAKAGTDAELKEIATLWSKHSQALRANDKKSADRFQKEFDVKVKVVRDRITAERRKSAEGLLKKYPTPGGFNKDVWAHKVQEAIENKKWAEKTKGDKKWMKAASEMSKDMLKERLEKTVEELATSSYRYMAMRAKSGVDEGAARQWKQLTGSEAGKEKLEPISQEEAIRAGKNPGSKKPMTAQGVNAPFKDAGIVSEKEFSGKWTKGAKKYKSDNGLEVQISKSGSQKYVSIVHSATGLGATMAGKIPVKASDENILKMAQEYGSKINWNTANIENQIAGMSTTDRSRIQETIIAFQNKLKKASK